MKVIDDQKRREYTGAGPTKSSDDYRPLTEDEANKLCDHANTQAERLGLRTRYLVVDDDG